MVRRVCQRHRQHRLLPSVPTLRAWGVSPISGTGPYIFTADIVFKELIDNINYKLEGFVSLTENQCNSGAPTLAIPEVNINSLLSSGTFTRDASVAVNFCYKSRIQIRDLINNVVIDFKDCYVNNLP